jgi:hypothetical protein
MSMMCCGERLSVARYGRRSRARISSGVNVSVDGAVIRYSVWTLYDAQQK